MKLWLLRPAEGLEKGDNPWEPWFDKCFGMVVRAESKERARKIAQDHAADEKIEETIPWRDEKYSICAELQQEGEVGVIIEDFASA